MIDSMMILDGILELCLVVVGTLLSRDLFQASVMFIFFGLMMAIAWCRLDAIDVALAEAAIRRQQVMTLDRGALRPARVRCFNSRTGTASSRNINYPLHRAGRNWPWIDSYADYQ